MSKEKLQQLFNEFILDKFILNFIPGLILFYILRMIIKVSIGDGLSALLIITSFSWVLGLILEAILFRKAYQKRREGGLMSRTETLNLLYAKIGVSVLLACVMSIDLHWFLNLFDHRSEKELVVIRKVRNFIVFLVLGVFLVSNVFKDQNTTKNE